MLSAFVCVCLFPAPLHPARWRSVHAPPLRQCPRSVYVSNHTFVGFAGPPLHGRGALRPLWTERLFIVTQHAICICLRLPLPCPVASSTMAIRPCASPLPVPASNVCLKSHISGFRGASRPLRTEQPIHCHAACYLHIVGLPLPSRQCSRPRSASNHTCLDFVLRGAPSIMDGAPVHR